MTSGECFENNWFYMKYIEKYLSAERPLTNNIPVYLYQTLQSYGLWRGLIIFRKTNFVNEKGSPSVPRKRNFVNENGSPSVPCKGNASQWR